MFPKQIYTHISTKTDLFYALSFPFFATLLFRPAFTFSTAALTYSGVQYVLVMVFGTATTQPEIAEASLPFLIFLLTVLSALAADLGFYIHHLLLHKVPFLWEFHKVHHSAEVLTPLTDFRAHPLEILTYGHAKGIGLGSVQGIFNYLAGNQISVVTLLGLNAVFCVYYLLAYTLRHSHVWISYGRIINHVLISPAQHQIHHSIDEKHHDKNMGGMFALWDWMFGTLYVPKGPEQLRFGIANSERYRSFWRLYVLPFQTNQTSKGRSALTISLLLMFTYFAIKRVFDHGLNPF